MNVLKGENVSTIGDDVVVKIKKIILHEKFNKATFDYDVALLRLEKPVTLSRLIRPTCIPKNNNNYKPGAKCIVAGWGYNKERRGSLPNLLHAVEVRMILFIYLSQSRWPRIGVSLAETSSYIGAPFTFVSFQPTKLKTVVASDYYYYYLLLISLQ